MKIILVTMDDNGELRPEMILKCFNPLSPRVAFLHHMENFNPYNADIFFY